MAKFAPKGAKMAHKMARKRAVAVANNKQSARERRRQERDRLAALATNVLNNEGERSGKLHIYLT